MSEAPRTEQAARVVNAIRPRLHRPFQTRDARAALAAAADRGLGAPPWPLVTRKLDGQMVYGLLVGRQVQFWTRAGPTEVGQEAYQSTLASGADFAGFVEHVVSQAFS